MIKLVQFDKRGSDADGLELAPGAARFARGWVIFFVAAALGLLLSMWGRAYMLDERRAVDEDHGATAGKVAS